ncbi:hypothetical protein SAMN06265348_113177 [Pedobacter westerhofensis]|uniref:Cyclic nucleotide-binding domain-containing protein n=2 Tax=Pedobacter westerhofensis TaxID=425512 RepID=A0A521FL21_9SPHI|nr:hypothetical protein SAMN06265348_113177 [Pedobacter westerhofensis]
MYSVALFNNLNNYSSISEEQFSLIAEVLSRRLIKKKRALIEEGDICRNLFFVEKGALRSYSTGNDGTEHVMQLAIENQVSLPRSPARSQLSLLRRVKFCFCLILKLTIYARAYPSSKLISASCISAHM